MTGREYKEYKEYKGPDIKRTRGEWRVLVIRELYELYVSHAVDERSNRDQRLINAPRRLGFGGWACTLADIHTVESMRQVRGAASVHVDAR